MAVVAPPPLNSNLDLWGPSESAIYPAVAPESMTDVMPYQYPPPPTAQNGADMELPPSGYIPNYSISQGSSGVDMGPSPDSNLSLDESQETSSKAMKMKQAMSSPGARSSQMQQSPPHHGAMQDQNALAMGGEKRRNKLGYHRTSVACGHCRRRKIRCIPSPADVQGRCVNCIRLKKECSFYPVDQQPPQDTRQKSSSRSSVGPKIASASSSPAMQTGLPSDMQGHHTYAQMSMAPIPNMAPPMKPSAANSLPPEAKVVPSASTGRGYEYAQGVTNWMSADPAVSKPGDLNATWRSYPAESPITPAFSPYTPHAPGPAATWAAGVSGEAAARDDMHWSSYSAPPARSMSFGAESMTGHHQQYPPIAEMSSHSSRSYSRKSGSMSTDMYPPTIGTSIPGVETIPGTTMGQHVSLARGAPASSGYESWGQPYSYSKSGDAYGVWYGEHGAHQSLATGDPAHNPGEQPQHGSGIYYTER